MSSILDALEKLEAASPQATRAPVVGRTETRRWWIVAPVVGAAFAAGIGIALLLRPQVAPVPAAPPLPLARPVPAPPHVEAPAVVTAPVENAPVAQMAAAPPTAPVVNVAAPAAAPPPAQVVATVPPAAPPQLAVAVPPAVVARPKPAPIAVPPPVVAPPPVAAPERAAAPRPPAGAPAIRVSFLAWSRAPERRTVALSIGDGSMTTLHEGERSDRIEVVEILPDGVRYRLDDGERIFTARAHD